jgi:hypothetical protein
MERSPAAKSASADDCDMKFASHECTKIPAPRKVSKLQTGNILSEVIVEGW